MESANIASTASSSKRNEMQVPTDISTNCGQNYATKSYSSPQKHLQKQLREQIEYYFSPANLKRDVFFQQVLDAHNGSVPVQMLAHFPKIVKICSHDQAQNALPDSSIEAMVCAAAASSRAVAVHGQYIRPISKATTMSETNQVVPGIKNKSATVSIEKASKGMSSTSTDEAAAATSRTVSTSSPTSITTGDGSRSSSHDTSYERNVPQFVAHTQDANDNDREVKNITIHQGMESTGVNNDCISPLASFSDQPPIQQMLVPQPSVRDAINMNHMGVEQLANMQQQQPLAYAPITSQSQSCYSGPQAAIASPMTMVTQPYYYNHVPPTEHNHQPLPYGMIYPTPASGSPTAMMQHGVVDMALWQQQMMYHEQMQYYHEQQLYYQHEQQQRYYYEQMQLQQQPPVIRSSTKRTSLTSSRQDSSHQVVDNKQPMQNLKNHNSTSETNRGIGSASVMLPSAVAEPKADDGKKEQIQLPTQRSGNHYHNRYKHHNRYNVDNNSARPYNSIQTSSNSKTTTLATKVDEIDNSNSTTIAANNSAYKSWKNTKEENQQSRPNNVPTSRRPASDGSLENKKYSQHQSSSNSYTTNNRKYVKNPNKKYSKLQNADQIIKEEQFPVLSTKSVLGDNIGKVQGLNQNAGPVHVEAPNTKKKYSEAVLVRPKPIAITNTPLSTIKIPSKSGNEEGTKIGSSNSNDGSNMQV